MYFISHPPCSVFPVSFPVGVALSCRRCRCGRRFSCACVAGVEQTPAPLLAPQCSLRRTPVAPPKVRTKRVSPALLLLLSLLPLLSMLLLLFFTAVAAAAPTLVVDVAVAVDVISFSTLCARMPSPPCGKNGDCLPCTCLCHMHGVRFTISKLHALVLHGYVSDLLWAPAIEMWSFFRLPRTVFFLPLISSAHSHPNSTTR